MGAIITYRHHNADVKVDSDLKGKHASHCLYWRDCKHFNPLEQEKNCMISRALYALDVQFNLVTPVWECPVYEKKSWATLQAEKKGASEIVHKCDGFGN
jgi:hypothetical protein